MIFNNKVNFKGAVIGMALGDGSLSFPAKSKNGVSKHGQSSNARLVITHKKSHLDYVLWKMHILNKLTSVRRDEIGGGFNENKYYRISTKCHPVYTKLHKRMYHLGRKTLDEHCLKTLSDVGLAILYMDDGSFDSSGSVELNKNSFCYAEQLMLQKCLKIKWDLDWNIHRKTKYYRLYLRRKDIPRFFKIIEPTVSMIPSMLYKINNGAQPKAEDIVRTV